MKKISIVVPCYNEEDCIIIFYTELKNILEDIGLPYEIIFVDDGSDDRTLFKIKKIDDIRIKYLSFSRNFGKEAAMYAGLKKSCGDYVAIMDADLQDPPKLLKKMIKLIEKENYDSIATRRVDRKNEPRLRSICANVFYIIFNKFTKLNIMPGARDFRLMKRNMVDSVLEICEKERFTKGIFSWVGFKTKWITFNNTKRLNGKTKWSFLNLFKYSISGLTSYSMLPLFLAYFGSIIFFILSLILFILSWCNEWRNMFLNISTLILFINAINLFILGIISHYLSKVYIEVRDRPMYVIREEKE